eukprot:g11336.t1
MLRSSRWDKKIKSCEQLLDVVAAGARARATAATGVHAHSSRSHALLVISLEHRWRDVGETDPTKYNTQVSRLTLVDLAGAESMERAHGGAVDAAGVGTNMGLLVLGRRVPYRDSSLTRLMQSSLGGKAKTQMLACVSPSLREADVTLQTLKYASSARSVVLKPEAAMDPTLNRRCLWIETPDFGDVFARCVGDPKDPLILYVHGSGPCNSSMFWNKLVTDVAALASSGVGDLPKSFFQVAIDCPGYGRSPGDRQSIRSYPGALISNIVRALGRKTVACLVGSSQGACATLNCALECPKLMHTIADKSTNTMVYENVVSGRIARVRPPGARVLVERLGHKEKESGGVKVDGAEEGMDEEDDEDDEERQEREAKEAAALLQQEATQSQCDFCRKPLIQPIRLSRCRCALCACCVEVTVRYMRECPVCESAVDVKAGKVTSDASNELLAHVEDRVARAGSKRSYTTFLKVVQAEGGPPEKGSVLKVDFNINPGYAKPTATAKEPNDKSLGFAFEYAMARAYPCHMTVHFKPELGLPKLIIEHYVRDEPKTSRRILIQLPQPRMPPAGAPRVTEKQVTFDAEPRRSSTPASSFPQDPPQNAWLAFQAGRSALTTAPQNFVSLLTGAPATEAVGRSGSRKSSRASAGSRRG